MKPEGYSLIEIMIVVTIIAIIAAIAIPNLINARNAAKWEEFKDSLCQVEKQGELETSKEQSGDKYWVTVETDKHWASFVMVHHDYVEISSPQEVKEGEFRRWFEHGIMLVCLVGDVQPLSGYDPTTFRPSRDEWMRYYSPKFWEEAQAFIEEVRKFKRDVIDLTSLVINEEEGDVIRLSWSIDCPSCGEYVLSGTLNDVAGKFVFGEGEYLRGFAADVKEGELPRVCRNILMEEWEELPEGTDPVEYLKGMEPVGNEMSHISVFLGNLGQCECGNH